MKKIFLFIPTLLIIVSTTAGQSFNNYGEKISPDIIHAYSSVKASIQNESMDNVTLEGVIVQTCPKKGCWMQVKVSDTDTLMVRFKDYGFFVPKSGVNQKNTVINGAASMDTVSVQMLRHFAEDAGKLQEIIERITEPETVIHFIAEGVLIEK